jgi:hypothetical protein
MRTVLGCTLVGLLATQIAFTEHVGSVGETIVVNGGPAWPCSPLQGSLPELMRLQKAMLDENVPDSIMNRLANAMMRAKAIMVGPKDSVTILAAEPGARRVRVTWHRRSPRTLGYQENAAAGCWISSEAIGLHR